MKAEERARRAFKYIYWRIADDMDKDVIAAWTAAIREAEQQARKEALDLLRDIREWDIARAVRITLHSEETLRLALPKELRKRIQALIEREGV